MEPSQYLTFSLAGEPFAIGILAIKEIIQFASVTPVPMMPESVRGVINLRGAVVPVIDLNRRFGRTPTEVAKRTCIVIVEIPGDEAPQVVGVMVDAVSAVLEIPADQIEPPPAFGANLRPEYMEGMGKVDGKFVILVDVNHVLSQIDAAALAAGMPAAAAAAQPAARA